jgi:hypothetical protein
LKGISEGLHGTLIVEPLEATKVSNARQWSSYLTVASITAAASLRARFRWRLHRYSLPTRQSHAWMDSTRGGSTWDEHGQGPQVADDRLARYRSLDSVPLIN